jgi:hypothetical protein
MKVDPSGITVIIKIPPPLKNCKYYLPHLLFNGCLKILSTAT